MNTAWLKACGIRALRTFCQTLMAYIATATLMSEVSWKMAFSAATLSAVLSVCMSVTTGLPEASFNVEEEEDKWPTQ